MLKNIALCKYAIYHIYNEWVYRLLLNKKSQVACFYACINIFCLPLVVISSMTPILLLFSFFFLFFLKLFSSFGFLQAGHSISVRFSSDCFHASTSRLTVNHRRAAHIHYLKIFWFASLIDISSLQTGEQGCMNNLHVDTSVLFIVHKGGRWQPMMRKGR